MDSPTVTPSVMALLAVAIPPLVSLLKSCNFPHQVNLSIAMAVSLGAGFLSAFIDGGLDDLSVERVVAFTTTAFTLSQLIYHMYFVWTPANERLEQSLWGPKTPPVSESETSPAGLQISAWD
jgi:hypothetical protein